MLLLGSISFQLLFTISQKIPFFLIFFLFEHFSFFIKPRFVSSKISSQKNMTTFNLFDWKCLSRRKSLLCNFPLGRRRLNIFSEENTCWQQSWNKITLFFWSCCGRTIETKGLVLRSSFPGWKELLSTSHWMNASLFVTMSLNSTQTKSIEISPMSFFQSALIHLTRPL